MKFKLLKCFASISFARTKCNVFVCAQIWKNGPETISQSLIHQDKSDYWQPISWLFNIKPCAHFRYPQIYSSCVATNIKVETFLFHTLLTWRGQVTRYLLWNREGEKINQDCTSITTGSYENMKRLSKKADMCINLITKHYSCYSMAFKILHYRETIKSNLLKKHTLYTKN